MNQVWGSGMTKAGGIRKCFMLRSDYSHETAIRRMAQVECGSKFKGLREEEKLPKVWLILASCSD